jgi:hypothetical protein
LPGDAKVLHFVIQPHLVANSGPVPQDAFEVALLDAGTMQPLAGIAAGLTQTDALLNVQQDGQVFFSPLVTVAGLSASGQTAPAGMPLEVTIDLSGVTAGTRATLYFDLLGFGPTNSSVSIAMGAENGGEGGGGTGGGGSAGGGSSSGGGGTGGGGTTGSPGSSGSVGSVGVVPIPVTGGTAEGIAAASASRPGIVGQGPGGTFSALVGLGNAPTQPGELPESHGGVSGFPTGDQPDAVRKGHPMLDGGGDSEEPDDFWPWLGTDFAPGPRAPESERGPGAPTRSDDEGVSQQTISRAVDAIMLEAAAAQSAGSFSEVSGLRRPSSALAAVDALFGEGTGGSVAAESHVWSEEDELETPDDLNLLGAGLLGSLPFLTLPWASRRPETPSQETCGRKKAGLRQPLEYDQA